MLGNTSSCAGQVWISSCVLGLGQLMVLRWCLKFFLDSRNSASSSLLIMTSLFIYQCIEHGQTDWDSQYLSWEEVYGATIALGRYSSHSGKIHYIQDGDLCLYMWHHLQRTLAIYTLGLITPSIHILPADFASV